MKFSSSLLLSLCLAATTAFAGNGADYSTSSAASTSTSDNETVLPIEFEIEAAYIGNSDVERGTRKVRDFDEAYGYARFIYRPRTPVGYLRLGGAYERYEFDMPELIFVSDPTYGEFYTRPELPDTLQSIAAVVGLDTKFSDSLLFRIEAQPGFYGNDHLDSDMFNVPFLLGGTYIFNPDFQLTFGASVDVERRYPVFPGGGFRWRMARQWVLNAVMPTPRLEFEATRNLTLYAGGDLKGSSYRMSDHFGDNQLNPRLNHAILTYSEIRVGGGVQWKISPGVDLSVEGGYVPYRDFDYHRADVRYKYDSGAPYGAVALHAAF
jgi:hypothetical protein